MPLFGSLAHTWWFPLLFALALGHISNLCVTLYLHRSMTHQGVVFHPIASHFMRFWLWLTTGMKTREWVAVHRKHHAFADRAGDPHSPEVDGFWNILLGGVFFYRKAVKDQELLDKYGYDCPNDWIERHLYSRYSFWGIALMLGVDILLFGPLVGLLVWSAMAVWVPLMGNIINGAGHALGYRNFHTRDHSHNLYPLGIWIVGEELHNNHHADPRSAKFGAQWWEFDIGWLYIRLLSALRLAKVVYARTASVREFSERHLARAKDAARGAAVAAKERAAVAKERALAAKEAAVHAASEAMAEAAEAARERAAAAKAAAGAAKDAAVAAAEAAAEAAQEAGKPRGLALE